MSVATQENNDASKSGEWRAEFRGIIGWAHEDGMGRLVFIPDGSSLESSAYQQSVVEVGENWDEWTFETDVQVQRNRGGVMLVENS